eukprot:scaffold229118_cov29-Attheya_sp.AAC.1
MNHLGAAAALAISLAAFAHFLLMLGELGVSCRFDAWLVLVGARDELVDPVPPSMVSIASPAILFLLRCIIGSFFISVPVLCQGFLSWGLEDWERKEAMCIRVAELYNSHCIVD